MKLSVLLPTRNGAEYLEPCLEAVLAYEGGDLELVVADNANMDATPDILARYAADPRLRVVRSERVVPVTENWNNALRASTGTHVLMVGDDDLLLPGAIGRLLDLLEGPIVPDCITYNAYSFVFPSAMTGGTSSRYAPRHFRFDQSFVSGELLDAAIRRDIVRDMFRFRPRMPLNMQTTVFSRQLADSIPGGAFRPPFPDHFALNAMLLKASRWLFVDERMLVIGVSPKSFGHFVYSNRSGEGLTYLGIETDLPGRLPGNELLTAMYVWLELLRATFPQELHGIEVSRGDYAIRQAWSLVQQQRIGGITGSELRADLATFPVVDLVRALRASANLRLLRRALRRLRQSRGDRIQMIWEGLEVLPGDMTISKFAASVGAADGARA